MAMLSKLQYFRLFGDGRRYALADIAASLKTDYPAVTHFLYRNSERKQMMLPWHAVKGIDWRHGQINVSNFDSAQSVTEESLRREVLLRRDVLDALVLDLHNRRATRANDLWLEEENGTLLLKAADTSSLAILRRLSRGLFGSGPSRALCDWKYIEFLRGDPHAVRSGVGYHMRIQRLPPGEIAGLCNSLPYLHAAELLTLLPDAVAAETLAAMMPDRQVQVFGEVEDKQAVRLLARMRANDAANLLRRLTVELTKSFLDRLPKARSEKLVELLRYPEATIGGIMTNDLVVLALDQTIREARLRLRERLKQTDFTHFLYVVESEANLLLRGTTSLQDLIVTDDERRLDEIMNSYVTTLDPLEPADAGAYRVLNSHLAAMPVIGREKRLLGIVTVDAAVTRVAPQSWTVQAPKIFS
ncbi:MAG TPA: CBS domain-containing protein [Candidatus Udaeobacter sp.]|nr:CBS domain-containing protein [Candidatus Udaeobacter sp.]